MTVIIMSRILLHYKNTTLCENSKNSGSRSIFLLILKGMPKRYSSKYIRLRLIVTCIDVNSYATK